MNDQAQDTSDPSARSIGWGWVVWLGMALALYVLSIGPAVMLVEKKRISVGSHTYEVLVIVYKPLQFLNNTGPVASKCLNCYLHLWIPEKFDSHGDPK